MEEKKINIKNVQLILRPGPRLLKVLLIVLIIFSLTVLIVLNIVTDNVVGQNDALRREAGALEQDNQDYEDKQADLGSVKSIKEIAQEELGLVSPDTIIVKPE